MQVLHSAMDLSDWALNQAATLNMQVRNDLAAMTTCKHLSRFYL